MTGDDSDSIVDRFAETLARDGIFIEPSENTARGERIISIFPASYPPSFMSLISRYDFDEFTAGNLTFFANRGDSGPNDLANAIVRDQYLLTTTRANGFLHFARPADGSYDPICFDIRAGRRDREFPVVRLEHEEILQSERIRIVALLYLSFLEFMKMYSGR